MSIDPLRNVPWHITAERNQGRRRRRHSQRRANAVLRGLPDNMEMAASPVDLAAAAGDSDDDVPTFEMLAYDGGPMHGLPGYPKGMPVYASLDGIEHDGGVPALRDHKVNQTVGYGVVQITASGVQVSGRMSGSNEYTDEVINASRRGFKWQVSIGAQVLERHFVPEGASERVNGRVVEGPAIIATRTKLREVSFVGIGANDGTSATIAASGEDMNFLEWLRAQGYVAENGTESDLTDSLREMLYAQWQGTGGSDGGDDAAGAGGGGSASSIAASGAGGVTPPANTPPANPMADFAAARQRSVEITDICARYDNPTVEVDGTQVDLAAHAMANDWSMERIELHCLQNRPPAPSAFHGGQGGGGGEPVPQDVIVASLSLRAGLSEEIVAEGMSENSMNEAMSARGRRFRSLHAVMHEVIRAAGMHYQPGQVDDDFIRAAFRANDILASTGGFTTLSLPTALGAVAFKSMLAQYRAQNTNWQNWCSIASHSNFHTHTRVRVTSDGQFVPVGPDGEIKHGELMEETYQNKVDTRGRMMTLTRVDIRNDDLDALTRIAQQLGRGAALAIEMTFWRIVLNGVTSGFFHANNDNLITTVLGIQGLSDAEQKYMDQVDAADNPILNMPDRIGVPTLLKTLADQLYNDSTVNRETDLTMISNPHRGGYRPYPSTYMNNTKIKGPVNQGPIPNQSDTAWMMGADPNVLAGWEAAFLDGNQTPTIQSGETHFNILGMSWRGFWDYGIAEQDPKAVVWSDGTA